MNERKKQKLIKAYLDSLSDNPSTIFENVLLHYRENTLVQNIKFHEEALWNPEVDYISEKIAKKQRRLFKFAGLDSESIDELVIIGYSIYMLAEIGNQIFEIDFNEKGVNLNTAWWQVDEEPNENDTIKAHLNYNDFFDVFGLYKKISSTFVEYTNIAQRGE